MMYSRLCVDAIRVFVEQAKWFLNGFWDTVQVLTFIVCGTFVKHAYDLTCCVTSFCVCPLLIFISFRAKLNSCGTSNCVSLIFTFVSYKYTTYCNTCFIFPGNVSTFALKFQSTRGRVCKIISVYSNWFI